MNFGNIPVKERMNSSFQHSRKLRRIGFSFFKLTLFCFLIFLVVGVVSIYGMFRGIIDSAPDISSDRKSTRLNSSHVSISYAVFCLKKKTCELLTYSTREEC